MLKNFFLVILVVTFSLAQAETATDKFKEATDFLDQGLLTEARNEVSSLLSIATDQGNKSDIVKARYILGYIDEELDHYGNAVIHYLEGAQIAEKINDLSAKKDLISIYKNLAAITSSYSNSELTYKFIDRGIEIAKEIGNDKQLISLLSNRIYQLLDEKQDSIALIEIQHLINNFQLDSSRLLQLKNRSGIAYLNLRLYDQAIEEFEFIISNAIDENNRLYAHALHNLGEIYTAISEYDMALNYYQRSIQFRKENGFDELMMLSLKDAAETYIQIKNYDSAIVYLLKAKEIEVNQTISKDTYTIYKLLSDAYHQKGDAETALEYNYLYSQKLEAFIAEQRRIEELDKKYNIQLLTERYFDLLAASEKQRETETIAKIGVGATAGIFCLIIFNIYYKQHRVRRSIKREIEKIQMLSDI